MDWFVFLTPIVLLVVASPLLFVGCARFDAAPGVGTVAGPPLGTRTAFRLDMDSNLQERLPSKVVKITVQWSLESAAGGGFAILVPQQPMTITHQPPTMPIDPVMDPGALASIPSDTIGMQDKVSCSCHVTLANNTSPPVVATDAVAALEKNRTFVFRIQRRAQGAGFRVFHDGA
jgi:hypothetical protein